MPEHFVKGSGGGTVAEPERRSGGNVFTNKVGPLPLWGWMAVGLAVALVFYLYNKNKSTTTAAQNAVNTPGGVDSSLVPQFVNQTYTNSTPTPAPAVTVNNTVPADNDTAPKPHGSTTTLAYSWTDTGQKWSATQLAKNLGISIAALKPTNAAGKAALASPNKPMAKGAKFDYTKQPKGITTVT